LHPNHFGQRASTASGYDAVDNKLVPFPEIVAASRA
jgi:hypothetical protein